MVNYQYATALHNAAAICDVEALRRCLTPEALAACPIDTRDRDELESTALHALCRYAREYREDESRRVDDRNADVEVCLQLLVEAGADLEARDKLGCSPLQVLAWFSIVKFRTEATLRLTSLLLRHGANVNTWSGTYSRSASTRATTKHYKSPFNPASQIPVSSAASQILRLRALHAWVQVAGSES